MRQGKYVVRKGKFIHIDDIKSPINWENVGACVGIIVILYLALMA